MSDRDVKTRLIDYARDVIDGDTPVCTKHRWAAMRFLRDIEREGTADFPFVFDSDKADRFFRWCGLFKHRKGVLRGQYIKLAPIQEFVFGNVYGWVHMVTGYRRFTKCYWQVARKNAKSQSLAMVGLYELMAFDESGTEVQEVYCAATKKEQSSIVYEDATGMLAGCKLLKGKFTKAYGRLTHNKTESVMRALSKEDRRTGDGLNPQCGIIDEYHAHETSEMYDIIDSGMGARAQPLLVIITTAGFDLANPCYRVEYDLVKKILNPDVDVSLDSYFAMVNELEINETADPIAVGGKTIAPGELIDDPEDSATWVKANPIVCSYPEGVDYLRKKIDEAKLVPEKQRNVYTKHLNVWVNQRDAGYMNMAKWEACAGEIPDLRGSVTWVGIDLSAKIDLTSVAFEFRRDGQYFVATHSFMPEDALEAKIKADRVPYDRWAADGWLTLTPGEVVDYRAVVDYIRGRAKDQGWYIEEWCVDPWGTAQVAADLTDEGETVVEIVQGPKTLSEPTKDFRDMVYLRRVTHDGSPVTSWAMSNAVVDKVDRNENLILSKKKARQRIDPVAAMMNAHCRAMMAEEVSTASGVLFI